MITLLEGIANFLVNSFEGKDGASCFLALIISCIAMAVVLIAGHELIQYYARKPYRHKGGLVIWEMNRSMDLIFITVFSTVIIFILCRYLFNILFNILLNGP